MTRAFNYMTREAQEREEHGLHGGGAPARLHAPEDAIAGATLDESNAFSYVEAPSWTWLRQAAPLVIAPD
eukprot:1905866-Pyramimonas_sp.AAC.1